MAVFTGYFALGTAISNAGVLTEVSGGSYARLAVNLTGTAIAGLTQNLGAFVAAAAPVGGTIYYEAIFDALTGGNMIAYWPVAVPASSTVIWGAQTLNVAFNTVLAGALNLALTGGAGSSGSIIDQGAQIGTVNGLPFVTGCRLTVQSGGNLGAHIGTGTMTSSLDVLGNISMGGLFNESRTDSITAHSGGGQTSAVLLTTEMNRVTTVAAALDSVMLPPSVGGLTIIVENAALNPMQVFGSSPDTINGNATATGVTQMQGSVVFYTCYSPGAWFANGLGTGYAGSYETTSITTAITAHAGGLQTSAVPLTSMMNVVSVCASTNDSVLLPVAVPGMQIILINNGVSACAVYPQSGSNMNGSLNALFSVVVATPGIFYATTATSWWTK